jgi:hypothetical protein
MLQKLPPSFVFEIFEISILASKFSYVLTISNEIIAFENHLERISPNSLGIHICQLPGALPTPGGDGGAKCFC